MMTAVFLCVACGEKSVVDVVEKMYDDGIVRVQKAEEMNDVQQIYDEVTKQVTNFKGEHLKEFASLDSSSNALQKARETFVKACCIKLNGMGSSLQTENGLLSIDENGNFFNPLDFAGDDGNYIADDLSGSDCDDMFGSEIEEPALTWEEQLNLISYKLDWTSLKDGCKPFKKDGFHLVRMQKNEEMNNVDTTEIKNPDKGTTTEKDYPYSSTNRRFVMENGKRIVYNPNTTIDDLTLFGAKECIMHLAAIKMRTDPRIRDSESYDEIIHEAWYYLLYKDDEVRQDIKKIAEEHYLAACSSYGEQGKLQKVLKTSKMRLVFNPSQAQGIIIIEFNFDENGYLEVKSAYVTWKFDISSDIDWMFSL